MKTSLFRTGAIAIACAATFAIRSASANEALWTGIDGTSATTNWSDLANWRNIGAGGAGPLQNAVVFDDSTGVADAVTINSVVDANQNPFSIAFTNFATFQNLLIAPGKTLFVSTGGLTNGNATASLATTVLPVATISGPGGTLVVSNGSVVIGDGYSASSGSAAATLIMSNLDTFLATNVSRMLVGVGAVRMSGNFFLAKTNYINLNSATSPQLDIGDNTSNSGGTDNANLGMSNLIFVDNIAVGRTKQGGASLRFNPVFTNNNNPTVFIRAHDGTNPVTTWSLGDGNGVSGTSTGPKGTIDFSGGTINVVVSNMWLGRPSITSATAPTGQGTLTFSAGTFTVINNLTNAVTVTPTTGGPGNATGTINVNGTGILSVNNNLIMGILGSGTSSSTGTLNINYGTVLASNIVAGTGTTAINMVGGLLVVTNVAGTSALPLGTMTLSNSTIQITPSLSAIPITVDNLTADGNSGDTNFIILTSLPVIGSFPATITLIESANSINLQNGNFNFALGAPLPVGYAGSIVESPSGNAVQLLLTSGPSAPDVWTGADIAAHHNTNWSDGLNWMSGAAPGSSSLVFFNNTDAQGGSAISSPGSGAIVPASINNIVDNNFIISALTYTNFGGNFQNTFINAGDTLTVENFGVTVGSSTVDYGNTTANATISGPAGTLTVTNAAAFYVGLGDGNGGDTPSAVLDMSGLGAFNATTVNFLTGVGGFPNGFTVAQPAGTIYLAKTNTITATSVQPDNADATPVALEVGDADQMANSLGSVLYLGMSNGIFADNISIGRQLASGGIFFNPAFTNAGPSAYFRGASASAVGTWTIGDGAANSMSVSPSGTNDFSGGTVNAVVTTMYVGKSSAASMNTAPVTGTLTFDAGTISANTLNVSFNAAASDQNVYSYAVGTVNVNGTGALLVNSTLNLASTAGALQGGASPVGTLNILNGGAILANAITAGTNNANSIINVNNATLAVTNTAGTVSAPLDTLAITNAMLDLGVGAVNPTIELESFTIDGVSSAHNTINILSLPPIASYPVTFKIIQAVNDINVLAGVFNIQLGTVPVGSTATLSEGSDNASVVLTVLTGPIGIRPTVTWTGADLANQNTNWSDRLNWELPGAPTGSDNVIFETSTGQSSSELGTIGGGAAGLVFTSVNNIVDANFTISSLTYTNINGTFQNTLIADGDFLAITNAGGLTVGSGSVDFGAGATGVTTIAGANATLIVNNTNSTIFVGLGNSGSSTESATLDLSGLGTFNATFSRMLIGVGSSSEGISLAHMSGTVYLARTNNLTAVQAVTAADSNDTGNNAVSIDIGDADGNSGANSALFLGQSNTIFADAIATCRQKENALMIFNLIFPNPSVYFRGHDGVSAVSNWDIAAGVVNSGSVVTFGTNDFSDGTVDALVDSMFIGRAPAVSGDAHALAATGVLNFGAGVINVASLYAGYEGLAAAPFGVGIVNMSGPGALIAGSLNLGFAAGGTGASTTSGTLNMTGGSVQAGAIVAGTNSISAINMLGGSLAVATTAGNASAPLGSLSLSNSTLQIPAAAITSVVVTTLNLDGQTTTTNLINVSSVSSITAPAELPLIQYGSLNLVNGTFNMQATLPSGYSGFITNDTTSNTVAVVITVVPVFVPPVVRSITHNGNSLVISGDNGLDKGNYTVLTTTNITLPKTNWTRLVTNSFSPTGTFSFTNTIDPNTPQRYFLFQVP